MKKYIILVLVVLGALQLLNQDSITFKKSGHGLVEPVVKNNSITDISSNEFIDIQKKLYPNDKYMAFRYTLIEDIDSIEFYMGDNLVWSLLEVPSGWGDILFLIKDNGELTFVSRDLTIINDVEYSEVATTYTTPISSVFPDDREYHSESAGQTLESNDIIFDEKILLYTFERGYVLETSGVMTTYENIDGSIYIKFNK